MITTQILDQVLSLKPTSNKFTYALELRTDSRFKKYNGLELELILYPYKTGFNDNQGIHIQPYDSYLSDLSDNQKTLYAPLLTYGANLFGLFLGLAITFVYWIFNQGELFGLQSIVAIIGVYLVGKEIWGDLEQFLIDWSEKWWVRYYPSEYSYRLRSETTLDLYAGYARAKKYKRELILADKLDIIRRSNARDLKLSYPAASFKVSKDPTNPAIRLGVISMNEQILEDFEQDKVLISAKISLNRTFLWFSWNREFFQALDNGQWGCLDSKGKWVEEATFERITILVGRIKFYLFAKIHNNFRFLVRG